MAGRSPLTVAGAAADLAQRPHCIPYYPLAGHLKCAPEVAPWDQAVKLLCCKVG